MPNALYQPPAQPNIPVGMIKSFGPLGSKYEVMRPLHPLDNGDWMVEIMLVESGEIVQYSLSHLNDDPEAM